MIKYFCDYQKDNGEICGKEMTKHEFDQDGMCSNCAQECWVWFKKEILGL